MKGKHLLTLLLLFSCTFTINAQHKVSGVITEQGTNFPLIGVTIYEKDQTNGTSTDFDGKYELEVSDKNATLVFSYVGYTEQEVELGGKSTLDLSHRSRLRYTEKKRHYGCNFKGKIRRFRRYARHSFGGFFAGAKVPLTIASLCMSLMVCRLEAVSTF